MATKEIRYGTVEIPLEEFEPKNIKVRITTFIDLDVLNECKKNAASQKKGYQTLINEVLRDRFLSPNGLESRVAALEKKLEGARPAVAKAARGAARPVVARRKKNTA